MAFSVGDKVVNTASGQEGIVAFGPFDTTHGPGRYLIDGGDGFHRSTAGSNLEARSAFAVGDAALYSGDRVRVVGGPVTGYASGNALYLIEFTSGRRAGKGTSVSEGSLSPVADADADADTHTHGGIVYNLRSRYRDKDGDVWGFGRVDDVVRGTMHVEPIKYWHTALARIVEDFGPLTEADE